MAGSAMAAPFDPSLLNAAGTAEAPNPITLAPGQSVVLSFRGTGILEEAVDTDLPYTSTVAVKAGSPAEAKTTDITVGFVHPNFHPTASSYTDVGVITLTNNGPAGASYLVTIKAGSETSIEFGAASRTVNSQIPEFPTVALPVAAILGLVFIFGRKKEGL
ncbi:hypothetical protein MM_2119 [Methanosarcina mazei Go1]|nr:hypothetical protein MM_2119 [Methanosarcina mazei Go1]